MHSVQVVCMKFSQTGLPRRFSRSIVPPPTWFTTRAGAGWPMRNARPGSALPRLGAAEAEAAGRQGTELPGDAGELGVAELLGAVDAIGAGDPLGAGEELEAGDA